MIDIHDASVSLFQHLDRDAECKGKLVSVEVESGVNTSGIQLVATFKKPVPSTVPSMWLGFKVIHKAFVRLV